MSLPEIGQPPNEIAAQLLLAQLRMKALKDEVNSRFTSVKVIEPVFMKFLSEPPEERPLVDQFEHLQVRGEGCTADEAIDDWVHHLAKTPQSGKMIVWRVEPEIVWERNFMTGQVLWAVYARFAIIP